jgi:Peptidase family M20/M25/M40
MSPEIYRITERNGGVCAIGSCLTKPGVVTSVVVECRITLDQRHLDGAALAQMLQEAREASERFAQEGNVTVSWERLWQIEPMPFDEKLILFCDEAIRETCGKSHLLPSGPLHDAAEVARAGVPTVMMFVQSLHGISHNKIEDTKEEHLELAVRLRSVGVESDGVDCFSLGVFRQCGSRLCAAMGGRRGQCRGANAPPTLRLAQRAPTGSCGSALSCFSASASWWVCALRRKGTRSSTRSWNHSSAK